MNKRSRFTVFLCLFLCVMMVVGCQPVQTAKADEPDNVWYGDVNDDGKIDAKDVTMLRRQLAGGWNVTVNEEKSDINCDGEINAKDVTMLRRFLAGGWGVELPEKESDENKIYDTWGEYVEAGGTDEKITFRDAQLKSMITQRVLSSGKTLKEEGELWRSDVYELSWIDDIDEQITDISGLSELVNLKRLNIYSMEIKDISELAGLTKLEDLMIQNTEVSDIEPLRNLKNLYNLDIHGSRNLKSIDALSRLENLKFLSISLCPQVTDITPVLGLTELTSLYMSDTGVKTLLGIENLKNLHSLSISGTEISDISKIYEIEGLISLGIDVDESRLVEICESLPLINALALDGNGNDNEVDIAPIGKLSNLQDFRLSNAKIKNINVIGTMTGLTNMSLCNVGLTDISFVSNLKNLTYLNIIGNKVSDITAAKNLEKLTTFVANDNEITDVSPLKDLKNLNSLYLSGNKNLELVSDLSGLTNLWWLNLNQTSVSKEEVTALREALPNTQISMSEYDLQLYPQLDPQLDSQLDVVNTWEQYLTDGGVDEKIEFKDESLKQMIIDQIKLNNGVLKEEGELWRSDVYELTWSLWISANFSDMTGLGELVNLKGLHIYYNSDITDISEVAKLKNLNTLVLQGCSNVIDISPIMGLTNLKTLTLSGTGVSDVEGIEKLKNLTSLYIDNTNVEDITSVYELPDLVSLGVNADNSSIAMLCEKYPDLSILKLDGKGNEVDLKPIEKLQNLTMFSLVDAIVLNADSIGKLTNLVSLVLSDDRLTCLDVSNNTALTRLECDGNQLTGLDISNNAVLQYLECSDNQLTCLDLSRNTALISLYCYWNQLTELDISNNTALEFLGCSGNPIMNLDVRQNASLTNLYCDEDVNIIRE